MRQYTFSVFLFVVTLSAIVTITTTCAETAAVAAAAAAAGPVILSTTPSTLPASVTTNITIYGNHLEDCTFALSSTDPILTCETKSSTISSCLIPPGGGSDIAIRATSTVSPSLKSLPLPAWPVDFEFADDISSENGKHCVSISSRSCEIPLNACDESVLAFEPASTALPMLSLGDQDLHDEFRIRQDVFTTSPSTFQLALPDIVSVAGDNLPAVISQITIDSNAVPVNFLTACNETAHTCTVDFSATALASAPGRHTITYGVWSVAIHVLATTSQEWVWQVGDWSSCDGIHPVTPATESSCASGNGVASVAQGVSNRQVVCRSSVSAQVDARNTGNHCQRFEADTARPHSLMCVTDTASVSAIHFEFVSTLPNPVPADLHCTGAIAGWWGDVYLCIPAALGFGNELRWRDKALEPDAPDINANLCTELVKPSEDAISLSVTDWLCASSSTVRSFPLISFVAPTVTGVSPETTPDAAPNTTIITLTGANFGAISQASVSVDGEDCVILGSSSSGSVGDSLTCIMQQGSGSALPIIVHSSPTEGQVKLGASSTASRPVWISFEPLKIDTVAPDTVNYGGGDIVTLRGSGYGSSVIVQVIQIGDAKLDTPIDCSITSRVELSELTVTIPSLVGAFDPASVPDNTVAIRLAVRADPSDPTNIADAMGENTIGLNIALPPVISALSPTVAPSTAGGANITLTGIRLATASVFFRFKQAADPSQIQSVQLSILSQTESEVVATIPEHTVNTLTDSVDVQAQLSPVLLSTSVPFSYGAPTLTSMTPNALTAGADIVLTVTGNNFGTTVPLVITTTPVPIDCIEIAEARTHTSFQCTLASKFAAGELALSVSYMSRASTNTLSFAFADPIIDRVAPQTGPITGGYTITMFGNSFGESGTVLLKRFLSADETVPSLSAECPQVSYSPMQIVCTVPALDDQWSGIVDFAVTTNFGTIFASSYSQPIPNPPVDRHGLFVLTAYRPNVVSVRMAGDGRSLDVAFAPETDRCTSASPAPASTCACVLDIESQASLFGSTAKVSCEWLSSSILLVNLPFDTTINVGDDIAFIGGQLRNIDGIAEHSMQAATSRVLAPTNPPQPVVTIQGPTSVGPNELVTLSASTTVGVGGRAASYVWQVDDAEQAVQAPPTQLTLPQNTPAVGASTVVTLRITNFLGVNATATATISRVADAASPLLFIVAPAFVSPDVHTLLDVEFARRPESDSLPDGSLIDPTGSQDVPRYRFNWRLMSSTSTAAAEYFDANIDANSLMSRSLFVPAATLYAGAAYTFQVTATPYAGDVVVSSKPVATAQYTITCELDSIDLDGTVRRVYPEESLTLSATSSLINVPNAQDLEAVWQCERLTPEYEHAEDCSRNLGLDLLKTSSITLPPNHLEHNARYRFSVSFARAIIGTPLTDVMTIDTTPIEAYSPLAVSPVSVRMFKPQGTAYSTSLVSAEDVLRLEVLPHSVADHTKLRYSWTETRANLDITSVDYEAPYLVIPAGMLQADTQYRFHVVVWNPLAGQLNRANAVSADLDVVTGAPPVPGTINVTPTTGNALSTLFTVKVSDWKTPTSSMQLRYAVKISGTRPGTTDTITARLAKERYITPFSNAETIPVQLPAGEWSVIVEARDEFDVSVSSSSATKIIVTKDTTMPSSIADDKVCYAVAVTRRKLIPTMLAADYASALQIIDSLALKVQDAFPAVDSDVISNACLEHGHALNILPIVHPHDSIALSSLQRIEMAKNLRTMWAEYLATIAKHASENAQVSHVVHTASLLALHLEATFGSDADVSRTTLFAIIDSIPEYALLQVHNDQISMQVRTAVLDLLHDIVQPVTASAGTENHAAVMQDVCPHVESFIDTATKVGGSWSVVASPGEHARTITGEFYSHVGIESVRLPLYHSLSTFNSFRMASSDTFNLTIDGDVWREYVQATASSNAPSVNDRTNSATVIGLTFDNAVRLCLDYNERTSPQQSSSGSSANPVSDTPVDMAIAVSDIIAVAAWDYDDAGKSVPLAQTVSLPSQLSSPPNQGVHFTAQLSFVGSDQLTDAMNLIKDDCLYGENDKQISGVYAPVTHQGSEFEGIKSAMMVVHRIQCAFWNDSASDWQTDGCSVKFLDSSKRIDGIDIVAAHDIASSVFDQEYYTQITCQCLTPASQYSVRYDVSTPQTSTCLPQQAYVSAAYPAFTVLYALLFLYAMTQWGRVYRQVKCDRTHVSTAMILISAVSLFRFIQSLVFSNVSRQHDTIQANELALYVSLPHVCMFGLLTAMVHSFVRMFKFAERNHLQQHRLMSTRSVTDFLTRMQVGFPIACALISVCTFVTFFVVSTNGPSEQSKDTAAITTATMSFMFTVVTCIYFVVRGHAMVAQLHPRGNTVAPFMQIRKEWIMASLVGTSLTLQSLVWLIAVSNSRSFAANFDTFVLMLFIFDQVTLFSAAVFYWKPVQSVLHPHDFAELDDEDNADVASRNKLLQEMLQLGAGYDSNDDFNTYDNNSEYGDGRADRLESIHLDMMGTLGALNDPDGDEYDEFNGTAGGGGHHPSRNAATRSGTASPFRVADSEDETSSESDTESAAAAAAVPAAASAGGSNHAISALDDSDDSFDDLRSPMAREHDSVDNLKAALESAIPVVPHSPISAAESSILTASESDDDEFDDVSVDDDAALTDELEAILEFSPFAEQQPVSQPQHTPAELRAMRAAGSSGADQRRTRVEEAQVTDDVIANLNAALGFN
jgi:REJ domain/IPT/TIG domain